MNNYCLITLIHQDFGLMEIKSILCPANDYDMMEKHVIEMLQKEKTKEVHITHFYANGEVKEINIQDIPVDKEGYDVLKTLSSILPSYKDESPDFENKVEAELVTRKNPYSKEIKNKLGYKNVLILNV